MKRTAGAMFPLLPDPAADFGGECSLRHQLVGIIPHLDLRLERPLYLGLEQPARLICDGEHGLVASTGVRRQRVPLGRISRIVVGPLASFTPDALRRCLEAGISVTFLGEGNRVQGHAWGSRALVPGRAGLLQFASEDPEWWPVHYAAWFENMESAQVARSLLGLGHSVQRRDAAHARSVLSAHYRQRHGESAAPLFRALDAHLRAAVGETIHRGGWVARPDPALANRLINDFARLLGCTLQRAALDLPVQAGQARARANDPAWLARFVNGNVTLRHDAELIAHLLENELHRRYG